MKLIRRISPQRLAALLKRGSIIAMPTDTVYGLIGLATPVTRRRILRIKRRPSTKELPILISSVAMAKRYAHVSKQQERFLHCIWPGPVTVVLKNKKLLKGFFGVAIALRIPGDPFLRRVIAALQFPVTGTSANISGRVSLADYAAVIQEFKRATHRPDYIIKSFRTKKTARSSTIVDATGTQLHLIRKGPISFRHLKKNW